MGFFGADVDTTPYGWSVKIATMAILSSFQRSYKVYPQMKSNWGTFQY